MNKVSPAGIFASWGNFPDDIGHLNTLRMDRLTSRNDSALVTYNLNRPD